MTLGRGLPAQRTYVLATTRTMAQDIWMARVVRQAGLDSLTIPENIQKDSEKFTEFLTSMVSRIFQADLVGDLIAGMLTDDGQVWATERAKDTRNFVLSLVDEDEKRQMLGLLTGLLHHFLSSERKASRGSNTSSVARDVRHGHEG